MRGVHLAVDGQDLAKVEKGAHNLVLEDDVVCA